MPREPLRSASPEPTLEFMGLMWAVDHQLRAVSKRMMGSMGLTAPQRLAVRVIGRQPGLTLGALATLLHLHPGTVTGIVRRLEQAELVVRRRGRADTRRVHLALTAAGQRLDRRRKGTVEAAVRRTLDGLTAADVAATRRVMTVLAGELALQ